MAPSDALPARRDFPFGGYTHRLLPSRSARGRGGPLQFPPPPSERSTPLTAGGSSALRFQVLRAFHGLRPDTPGSAPPCPFRVGLTPRQVLRNVADRSVAPSKRLSTLGFNARRFPLTLPACYQAPWRLPGRDSHPLAVTSLRATRSQAIWLTSIRSSRACPLDTQ